MKTSLRKLLATIFVFASLSMPATAEGVVENIEGFPLLSGFIEDESKSIFFDKPEGRVMQGAIEGVGSLPEVMIFYKQSLDQIGWVSKEGAEDNNWLYFNKESETLSLEFKQVNSKVSINYLLIPSKTN